MRRALVCGASGFIASHLETKGTAIRTGTLAAGAATRHPHRVILGETGALPWEPCEQSPSGCEPVATTKQRGLVLTARTRSTGPTRPE
jgi:hypothetical protein